MDEIRRWTAVSHRLYRPNRSFLDTLTGASRGPASFAPLTVPVAPASLLRGEALGVVPSVPSVSSVLTAGSFSPTMVSPPLTFISSVVGVSASAFASVPVSTAIVFMMDLPNVLLVRLY